MHFDGATGCDRDQKWRSRSARRSSDTASVQLQVGHGTRLYGTQPSRDSVRSICRKISEATEAPNELLESERVVERPNWAMVGWANCFELGQVRSPFRAMDHHAIKRLRLRLCRKDTVKSREYVCFPDRRSWSEFGVARVAPRSASLPWTKA